ncbi:MAG TPA: GntR family transcriptional regulator [Vicinamibacterales bacterium]|jgi:DNA-binding GntR family transcriptional regulator
MTLGSSTPEQIVHRIVDVLRQRRTPAGEHLTEAAFAADLGLSRSPIRRAFARLRDRQLLVRKRNRGYFLAVNGDAIDERRLALASDPLEDLYLRVAEDLLSERIPEEFYEATLLRDYDVTRGQLLKLLARMANEGLVVRKPGHGWKVVPVLRDAEAHNQSYRFRMAIEPAALLEPTYRVDRTAFDEVRETQRRMVAGDVFRLERPRLFQIGAEFHEAIVRWSGNRFFLEAMQRQNQLRRLLEYRSKGDRDLTLAQCREHLRLLDLIDQGRQREAADFLRRHLDAVRRRKTRHRRSSRRAGGRPAGAGQGSV